MKVVVVIPCRNEVANIEECIHAIYDSRLPNNCELMVYVVDGKSNDGTVEKIKNLQGIYPNLNIVVNEQQLTPFAFNLGIQAVKDADYYQIIGARQVISSNYLKKALEVLESNQEIWCIGGAVENVYLNEAGKLIAKAMGTAFGMGLGNFRTLKESGFVDTVGTPMYPRKVFEQIGYFDEELIRNQDDDFNYRVTQAGGKIYFEADIFLKYYVRGNLKQLWKQFLQYGYWKVYVNKKHKAVTTLRQLVPPLFVLFLILFPLSWLLPIVGVVASGLLGLYVLLTVFISARSASSFKEFTTICCIYPILHISYGWGYLKGIIHFLIANKKPSDKQKIMSR